MVSVSALLITACLVPLVCGLIVWPIIKTDHIALAETVAIITRNHLSKASSTVVILERSWKVKMRDRHSRTMEHILKNLHGTIAVQLYNGQSDCQPWEYHIFVVDGIVSFADIGWNFPKTHFERNFHFLIVLTKYSPDFMKTLRKIFISCRRLYVVNANVILEHPVHGVCMYKYSIFFKNQCNDVQPYLYFCFNKGVNKLLEVFPRKILNFWGCPLRITARHSPPNLRISGNKLDGFEGDLLTIVSKALNFTIKLNSVPVGRTTYHNSTAYGCFAELLEGRADIAVGGFSASDPMRRVLTSSTVFHYSPIVFIVRKGHSVGAINRLLWPFQIEVWGWLAFCIVLGLLAIFFIIVERPGLQNFIVGERNNTPIFNLIAVFLGYPMTQLPLRNFARYILTLWLLMTLVIRNAYQGSLYDSFRTDRNVKTPQDCDDLIKWDYTLISTGFFKGFETFPEKQIIVLNNGTPTRLKKLEESKQRYATIVLRNNFINYLESKGHSGSKLIIVKKPALFHSSAFFFRKHSIYVSSVNVKLKYLIYAGITKRMYINNVKDKFLFKKDIKGSVTPEAIRFFRLKGIYKIWGYLLAISFVVLILELLSVRYEKLNIKWFT